MSKKNSLIIILFLLILFSFCSKNEQNNKTEATGNESAALIINNKEIVIIEGHSLTNSDFKNYLRSKYSDLKSVLNKENLISRLFDSFIEYLIILKSSESENISISDKEIAEYSGKNNIYLNSATKNFVINLLKIEKYLFYKVYKTISISKYEIDKYYNLNRKDFFHKQQIELYQILLKDRDKAIKIRAELLNNPSNFENIAKTKSVSQESTKNGYMGLFEHGDLPKEMENVVFSLPVNHISRVIESQFGFHIFKVSKKIRGKQKYLKDVRKKIEKVLINKQMLQEFSRYMKILRNSINIKIFYNNLFFKYSDPKGE